jgi:hypothetical protein
MDTIEDLPNMPHHRITGIIEVLLQHMPHPRIMDIVEAPLSTVHHLMNMGITAVHRRMHHRQSMGTIEDLRRHMRRLIHPEDPRDDRTDTRSEILLEIRDFYGTCD